MNYHLHLLSKSTSLVFFLALAILFSATLKGQEAQLQNWRGIMEVKVAGFVVQKVDYQLLLGSHSGDSQLVMVSQKGLGFPLDDFSMEQGTLKFKVKQLGVQFEGKQNYAKNEISGTFVQGGRDIPLTLKHESTAKHTATKTGIMKVGGKSYDLQFRFFTDEKEKSFALLDSFSENNGSMICQVKEKDGQLEIVIPNSNAKFVGMPDKGDAANQTAGHWKQNKQEFPLTLASVDLAETRRFEKGMSAKPNRPQNPKAPFPYEVEEFNVSLQKFNPESPPISLAGTLTTPKREGPFPAVILISGSGPQDRDETLMGHKPFWVIADHLSRNGFAVARYDERGVGKSTGDFSSADASDFAADVEALFTWLSENPKIAPSKIALIGHSEGGVVAPMIAARNERVAAIVSLAGPGVTGRRTTESQQTILGADFGIALNKPFLDRLESKQPFDEAFKEKVNVEMKALWKDKFKTEMPANLIETTITAFSSPWAKFYFLHDPAVSLAKTKCPVLYLIGENDTQVDADLNVPAIEAALKKAENADFEVKRLPKLNHLFQNSETGLADEYAKIEETFDPSVLKLMTKWLSKRLK